MKYLFIFFILSASLTFSQEKISSNPLDTLSIDSFGRKIELESNLDSIKKWNDYLLFKIRQRLKIKNLPVKVKTYYEVSEFSAIITDSYWNFQKGNNEKATNNFFYILKKANPKRHKKIIGYVYGELGTRYFKIEDFPNALKFTKKSLEFLNPKTEIYYTGLIYNNLGYIYKTLNDNTTALEYYKKSLKLRLIEKNDTDIAATYINISKLNLKLNDKKSAYENLKFAENILLKIDNKYDLSSVYYNLAQITNDNIQKTDLLEKSYNLAVTSENLEQIENSGMLLYDIKKNSNIKHSLLILENVIKAKDSLYRKGNQNALLKATNKYETEKKEAKIKQLSQAKKITELENQRQKNTLYLLIFGIFSVLITSFLLFKRYKTNKQNELLKSEIEKSNAEKKATESELKALKSQMNPHFIFNALNSIQEQFMFGDKIVANEQMGNFTTLTRQILSVSGKKKISLATEIDILTKYLELEKMRFENDFSYQINFQEDIDDEYTQLPPMIIQPFVENSIKHGLLHKEGLKELNINFNLNNTEDVLICIIEDNGIGRKKSDEIKINNKHNSFSTESIVQRLQLLNNDNENVIYVDLIDENGNGIGTRVIVKINL